MDWMINEKRCPYAGTWFQLQYSYQSFDLNGKPYTQWATEKEFKTRLGAEKALKRVLAD